MQIIDSTSLKALYLNLDRGNWISALILRIFLAWEFFEAGLEKWNGENWFGDIQAAFPFPFNHIPATLNWELSMWAELLCSIALLVGFGTRFSASILIVVTMVATAAVHWPTHWSTLSELAQGYSISNKGFGNFKLPVIYIVTLLPLLFTGAGKLSLDWLYKKYSFRQH